MKYINKNNGESICETTYNQLSPEGKHNFILDRGTNTTIVETRSNNMSVGDGIAVEVLAPIAIIASIFD